MSLQLYELDRPFTLICECGIGVPKITAAVKRLAVGIWRAMSSPLTCSAKGLPSNTLLSKRQLTTNQHIRIRPKVEAKGHDGTHFIRFQSWCGKAKPVLDDLEQICLAQIPLYPHMNQSMQMQTLVPLVNTNAHTHIVLLQCLGLEHFLVP